jgi:hypothetical protein
MATKKMQAGGAKKITTNKRPIDLNLKERSQKNAPLKGSKYQDGGMMNEQVSKATGIPVPSKKSTKETLKYVNKKGSGYVAPTKGQAPAGFVDGKTAKRSTMRYKTGGMVNPNAKLQAAKSAGSKGVTPGVNPKAAAAKKATGKSSGGVDTPPKTAVPKAKYGMSMTKMKK